MRCSSLENLVLCFPVGFNFREFSTFHLTLTTSNQPADDSQALSS